MTHITKLAYEKESDGESSQMCNGHNSQQFYILVVINSKSEKTCMHA